MRQGICFAPDHGLCLDAYLPSGPIQAVVMYLHGGGFLKGHRAEPLAQRLAARLSPLEVALVSPDYRLRVGLAGFSVQEAKAIAAMQARSKAAGLTLAGRLCGPAMIAAMQDVGAALTALRTGIVPELAALPVVICGVSAGGIAGLSLAYPPKGMGLARPDAVFVIASAMVQPWRLAPDGPPAIMLHGPIDRVIGPENPRLAVRRAKGVGADLKLVETDVPGHNSQIVAFENGTDAWGMPYFAHFTALLKKAVAAAKT